MKCVAKPGVESPFLSPKILDLFSLTLRKIDVDLVTSLDIVIASLNFLRLLLYRGRSRPNAINIWSEGSVENLKKNIIGPLKQTTIRCLDNESRDVHSLERQKVGDLSDDFLTPLANGEDNEGERITCAKHRRD